MKYSKDKLTEGIKLYLNDLEDYGDEGDNHALAEAALSEFTTILSDSEQDVNVVIREAIKNSPKEHKQVFKEFLEYLNHI